jgi:hypothetical protein
MTITLDVGGALGLVLGLLPRAVLVAAAALGVYWLYRRLRRWGTRRGYAGDARQQMRRRWSEVESLLRQPGETGRRLAVVEADKLLDHALKTLVMPGETLGERLKFAQYKYPELSQVWWAHRLRNQLVHETGLRLDAAAAARAVAAFKRAMERLGAL